MRHVIAEWAACSMYPEQFRFGMIIGNRIQVGMTIKLPSEQKLCFMRISKCTTMLIMCLRLWFVSDSESETDSIQGNIETQIWIEI